MKIMTIRIDEELHKKLKLLCVSRGDAMSATIISLIKKEIENSGKK